ncbi:MAG: Gfo/Idh/MocA family oxidoreductase [Pirellulales bacterium]
MRIFDGTYWQSGYLDYGLEADDVRVAVRAWCVMEHLHDVHIPQRRSFRRVWDYMREIGVRRVAKKIQSRMAESLRDRRVMAFGCGRVLEAGEVVDLEPGADVLFVAACHPPCVERIVVPRAWAFEAPSHLAERFNTADSLAWFDRSGTEPLPEGDDIAGWSRHAGFENEALPPSLPQAIENVLETLPPGAGRRLSVENPSPIRERTSPSPPKPSACSAVLFGLGNYAKVNIIPNLDRRIHVERVHEIDPTQIGRVANDPCGYDTCGEFRPGERYDMCLIAGFHHTHADLAVEALRAGSFAVVEKPLVTTRDQLSALLAAMQQNPGRLFACFHMRYNPVWSLARRDLRWQPGREVHYQCIVHEIPLPARHWYNWPNSGSRLISNGCHWLDHFLWMNEFAAPCRYDIWPAANGDMHVSVELDNGAAFSMALTDQGSSRVGVRDHVELRAGDVTVTVDDGRRYFAERSAGVIRRAHNRSDPYRRMYQSVSSRVLSGGGGDSVASVQTSSDLMLSLEELYVRKRAARQSSDAGGSPVLRMQE